MSQPQARTQSLTTRWPVYPYKSSPESVSVPVPATVDNSTLRAVSYPAVDQALFAYPIDMFDDRAWSFCTPSDSGLTTSDFSSTSPESNELSFSFPGDTSRGHYLGPYGQSPASLQRQEEFATYFPDVSLLSLTGIQASSIVAPPALHRNSKPSSSVLTPALEELLLSVSQQTPPNINEAPGHANENPTRHQSWLCPRSSAAPCSCESLSLSEIMKLPHEPHLGPRPARGNQSTCRLEVLCRFAPKHREVLSKIIADPETFSEIPKCLIISLPGLGADVTGGRFRCQCCPNKSSPFASRQQAEDHIKINLGIRPHKCPKCGTGRTRRYDLQVHEKKCKSHTILSAPGPSSQQTFGGANLS